MVGGCGLLMMVTDGVGNQKSSMFRNAVKNNTRKVAFTKSIVHCSFSKYQ